MPSNPVIRCLPVGIVAIFAILTGTIVAQVVPASRTPENPAPEPPHPGQVLFGSPQPAPKPAPIARQHDEDARMEGLIAAALDQKTDLNIKDKPILEAFEMLAEQTGVQIEVEAGTVGLLPYDAGTRVSASIKGRPLRESLIALLRPIGLQFDVENRRVVIRPTPPLRRCVERVTWKELALLERLSTTPWNDELAESLKFQFQDSPVTSASVNRDTLLRLARNVGQGTAAEVLEQATDQFGWTWRPKGDLIIVLPKTRQIEQQLQKCISVDYTRTSLEDALLDLATKAHVALRYEPGTLASLSPFIAERFSLSVENMPIRQVLELMAGQTGLAYYIEQDGVRITANPLSSAGSAQAGADDTAKIADAIVRSRYTNSVVGQILLPAAKNKPQIAFFIRENDLSPEMNEQRKALLRDFAGQSVQASLQAMTQPHD